MEGPGLVIDDELSLPEAELWFVASRSSGPGGQHVNKVESRVTLLFDVVSSPSLSEAQKERIIEGLQTRVNRQGVLRVTAQKHRSQAANRKLARERMASLLRQALEEDAPRRPTRPPAAADRRRLEEKRRRGRIKKERRRRFSPED